MVLLAAYQVLLSRHTGQSDILVGAATAGRDRVQLEPVIGYLSDTLVLRGDLSGDPTFCGLLRERRPASWTPSPTRTSRSRAGHGAEVERDLSRTPLFQTMIILHTQDDRPPSRSPSPGSTPTGFDHGMPAGQARTDAGGLAGRARLVLTFGYDTELFDRATVEAMAARFPAAPRGGRRPDIRLSEIDLLGEDERERSWAGPLPHQPATTRCFGEAAPASAGAAPGLQRATSAFSGDLPGSAGDRTR